ncbi:hypothetical protein QBC43DRAFT_87154 [Cladorrhinum sp. PSN259]|nr:hypothetical protein QBC43DRAFT_87154 [Cladorrhinum sp. PSN259]
MRIPTTKCWLTATALVFGIANGDTVSFSSQGFESVAIFWLPAGVDFRSFSWVSNGVKVEEVKLLFYEPQYPNKGETVIAQGVPVREDGHPPSFPSFSDVRNAAATKTRSPSESIVTGTLGSGLDGILRRQASKTEGLNVVSDTTKGSVTLDLQELKNTNYTWGFPLFFEATWSGGSGRSYSRLFTVLHDFTQETRRLNESLYQSPEPYKKEKAPTDGLTPGAPAGNTQSPSSNPPLIGDQGAKDSSSGGLPKGAVIGIAVGAGVLGLIAVIAFVWIVVRRQKRKQNLLHVDSYNSGNPVDDLIAEKEARAGVDVTTPQSPYSDDGNAAAATATPPAAAASPTQLQQQQDPNQTFTPYTDRSSAAVRPTDDGRASVVPSPIPGRETPRDLATPYAHLVEEGMTEDDVRRLEEEERQLDAAIEQARRR